MDQSAWKFLKMFSHMEPLSETYSLFVNIIDVHFYGIHVKEMRWNCFKKIHQSNIKFIIMCFRHQHYVASVINEIRNEKQLK